MTAHSYQVFAEQLRYILATTEALNELDKTCTEDDHHYLQVHLVQADTHLPVGEWTNELGPGAWSFNFIPIPPQPQRPKPVAGPDVAPVLTPGVARIQEDYASDVGQAAGKDPDEWLESIRKDFEDAMKMKSPLQQNSWLVHVAAMIAKFVEVRP